MEERTLWSTVKDEEAERLRAPVLGKASDKAEETDEE